MTSATELKGFYRGFYDTELSKAVESNLISFFDWGLIDKGAYTNIDIVTSGAFGGDFSTLRPVNDPRYTTNTVYEAMRGNWVWESGMSISTPIKVSGVWINNVLSTSGFNVDYPNGRIIFDAATTGPIQAKYSYKEVQFISARDNPLFQQVQYRSRRPDDGNFATTSGLYFSSADSKMNLPCVSIEIAARNNAPYQIGGGQWVRYVAKFHVLGEDDYSVSKIADIIGNQDEKTIFMYDIDRVFESGAAPLSYLGYLNNGAKTYPQLVETTGTGGYRYTSRVQQGKMRMFDFETQNGQWIHQNLYLNTVSCTCELIVPNL